MHQTKLGTLEGKAKKFDHLIQLFQHKKYSGSRMANHLFATAASMVPQAGMSGVATIIPMIVGAVLENAGIKVKTEDIVQILPVNDTIAHMVIQNASNTVMLTKESIKNNPIVYISCNKENKKGNKNLAKYL